MVLGRFTYRHHSTIALAGPWSPSFEDFVINLNLSVELYGCEICFLTLREKRRLKLSEKRILSEYLGPKEMRKGSGQRITGLNKNPVFMIY